MKRLLPLGIVLLLLCVFPRLDAQRVLFTTGTAQELALAQSIGLEHLRTVAAGKGIEQPGDLAISRVHVDSVGLAHTRVQQYYRGVPVLGGEAIAHIGHEGAVFAETDSLVSGITVNPRPRLTTSEAIAIAVNDYGCSVCLTTAPVADLWVLRNGGQDHLVYRVQLTRLDNGPDTALPVRFVDAHGGYVVLAYDNLQTGVGRSLYSGDVTIGTSFSTSLGQYVLENLNRRVGTIDEWTVAGANPVRFLDPDDFWQGAWQRAAVDAQYGTEQFLDYLQVLQGRNGIDGNGGPRTTLAYNGSGMLASVVHYGSGYNNAFWSGGSLNSVTVFGDGDGVIFSPLVSLDLIGHEMMHGVNEYTARLFYMGEAGALSESWSDVFGAMTERYVRGESANTWLHAEEAYTPGTSGDALRYLDNPHRKTNWGYTADDDPDHYSERYTGTADNNGVHANAGIANKAFYLLATGGTHHLGGSMTGIGTDAAARIWFSAMQSYMTSVFTFAGARDATMMAAAALYGSGSPQHQAVSTAWCLVGVGSCVDVQAVSVTPNNGSGSTQSFTLEYSDSLGATDLVSARVRFGASNVGPGTCTARYNAATGAVGLLDDAGTAWNDAGVLGIGTLANTQCTLNLASSFASPSGTKLSVVLNITFSASFTGPKQIYMMALSTVGANSGWQLRGTWSTSASGPAAISATPSSGSGGTQAFTLEYSDSNGALNLTSARVRFGANNVGPATCSARYNAATGAVGLLDDAGAVWNTGVMGSGTLANSQCALNLTNSSATVNGNNLTIVFSITFNASFTGVKQIYMLAVGANGVSTGWQQRGTWTPYSGLGQPKAVSASPSGGSGLTQSFTLQYSDTAGAADLVSVRVRFGESNVGPATCSARYNTATGAVGLLDDAGTVWNDTGVLGNGTLANTQCTLDLASSSATPSGNNLSVVLRITFSTEFSGLKQIYMLAASAGGGTTGWQQRGTWNVQATGAPLVQAISATPYTGSGPTQAFTLQYSDPAGAADLLSVRVRFAENNVGPGTCTARYNPMTGAVGILNDAGTTWIDTGGMGIGTLGNSQCTLNLASSAATSNGNTLTVVFYVTFNASFSGLKQIYLLGQSTTGSSSGWQQRGTWNVPGAGTTGLFLDSQPGDVVGQGVQRMFTPADSTIRVSRNDQHGVGVQVFPPGQPAWSVDFTANEAPLQVGWYGNATRHHYNPFIGLTVAGGTYGTCNDMTGRFTVLEIAYDALGDVQRLAVDFEQHCQDATPALVGAVRYNSTIASFNPFDGDYPSYRLRIAPPTFGRVDGAGLDCGNGGQTCEVTLGSAAVLTVNATPDPGYLLAGWTGSCVGSRTITVNVNSELECAALFLPINSGQPWTLLFWNSQLNDYVGGGKRYVYSPANTRWFIESTGAGNGLNMLVQTPGERQASQWVLRFEAPTGQVLGLGTYTNATRFQTPSAPAIDIGGHGRGCDANSISSFVVHELTLSEGVVARLALDFEQHCVNTTVRPLRGSIRYNSTLPPTATLAVTISPQAGGSVVISPSVKTCIANCVKNLAAGANIQLAGTPSEWFVSWEGDADCVDGAVTMSAPTRCDAKFLPAQLTPLTPEAEPDSVDHERRSTTLKN
jgi:Zn-dependent metalloprotease